MPKFIVRHRSWFAFATTTLAVAVGVNLIVFTVVNALWLRPLPFPDADRLVALPEGAFTTVEAPALQVFGQAVAGQVITDDRAGSLQPRIAFDQIGRDLETFAVTPGYFRLFGLPIRGRDFTPDDNRTGAEPVAIISNRLWSEAFGGNGGVIGTVISARPISIRVIGVAPPGFAGARRGEKADIWIPSGLLSRVVPVKANWFPLMIFARLPAGQTVTDVDRRLREKYTNDPLTRAYLTPVPLKDVYGTPVSRTIVIQEGNAFAMVGGLAMLVLLGGCATLAALVLVHSERRRGEVAVRIALGASRTHLILERARELSWVAVSGSAGALLIAFWGLRAIPTLSLPGGVDLGRLDLSIDWRVLSAAIATTVLALIAAAGLPILRSTRLRRASELWPGPAATASVRSQRLRQALLAFQVGATIIVLVAAGLFVRAVIHGFGNASGFDVDRTAFVRVQLLSPLADAGPGWKEAVSERTARVTEALRALPGIDEVAEGWPTIGPDAANLLNRPVVVRADGEQHTLPLGTLNGSPELLATLGVPIVAGRPLTATDQSMTPVPAVVTMSLAQRLWPAESPLGKILWTDFRGPMGRCLIVGVARDVVFGSLARPAAGVIVTTHRVPEWESRFVIRAVHPDAMVDSMLKVVKATVPDAPSVSVATGREIIARDLGRQRLGAWFFSGFGLAALILGVGGAFGLVAYLAESRRREFGIRLALGATTRDLVRHGLTAALMPVSIGVGGGLLCAAWLSRVFTSLLTGLSALDAVTYAVVGTTMLCSAASAALAAAWRLRRMTPADVLRTL